MQKQEDLSFKDLFVPLTTIKAMCFILVIGLLVFSSSLLNGFVFDDIQQIVENTAVHSVANIITFFTGSTFYNGGSANFTGVYYKPLLTTFFSIIYTVFGPNPPAFHFFQLLLHIANACFLFLLFKRWFGTMKSFLLSLVFLIHPAISEAVFYIASAQDTLFLFFGIISLLMLERIKTYKALGLMVIPLLFSILSKETGVLFIAISIVYVFIFKRRLLVPMIMYSVITFFIYVIMRLGAIGLLAKAASAPVDRLTLLERISNMPSIFLFYLKQFMYPFVLSSSYQWVHIKVTPASFTFPLLMDLLFLFAVVTYTLHLHKKRNHLFKPFAFFLIWFLIGMAIHMQFFPLDATVADRWFYFPMVGLIGMVGVVSNMPSFHTNRRVLAAVLVFSLLLLGIRTFIRGFDWKDELTLAYRDSFVSKNDYYLENMLSINLSRQKRFREAKKYALQSIDHFPFYTNINTLGTIYTNEGDYKKARKAYIDALKYGDFYLAYENLGGLTLISGQPQENIALLTNILQKYPRNDRLWLYLAVVEYKEKNLEEAKIAAGNAYRLAPNYTNGYYFYKLSNNEPLDIKIDTVPRQ